MRTFCLLALLSLSAGAPAADWTDWRGPMHNGVCLESGLPESWDPESGENVLWDSPIGGRAAPIVMNGRIYLDCRTSHDVNSKTEGVHAREQVVCRDAATGEVVWVDEFNVAQTDIPAPRVGWAAMVGDPESGNVFVHSVSGVFRCYSGDGERVWERHLFEEFGKISGYGGRTVTPIIDEDRIIVAFFGMNWGRFATPPPRTTFYAFDKNTGELLWTSMVGGPPLDTTYSNPAIGVIDGQRVLVCGGADGALHAINARNGAPIWSYKMSKRGLNMTPVIVGDRVYMSHGEDNADSIEFGRVECIDGRGTGDITETNSVWRVDGIKAGYSALVERDGILYVVADTGNLHAMDAETGEELWTHSLGTVGKGAPTWADGKLYVMEVGGAIHILKPSREGCESLSRVVLKSSGPDGLDEIYATPAISDGRVFFVTRDRTICIGGENAGQQQDVSVPELQEADGGTEVASIQLRPFDRYFTGGGSVEYTVVGFNRLGQQVDVSGAQLSLPDGWEGASLDGNTLTIAADAPQQAGEINAALGDLTAFARVRNFTAEAREYTFDGLSGKAVPETWVNARGKLIPTELEGSVTLANLDTKRPSNYFWLGPPDMKDYTIAADVRMTEERRKLPGIGITAQRYNFILKGNSQKVGIQSWAPHLRMAKEVRFRSDPNVWYRLKLTVRIEDDGAHVLGKIWKRDEPEPEEWTIEAVDPHPNESGAPGLYTYLLAPAYFDNVSITPN